MAGAIVAYRNLADAGTLSIGVGTAVAGFPVSNLQTRQLSTLGKIKRSGVSPFARLDCDLGAIKDNIRVIAFIATNYTVNGTPGVYPADFRFQYSTNGSSWSSGILSTTNAGLDASNMGLSPISALILTTPISARFLRTEPSWVSPVGGTDYVAGRFWVSDAVYLPDGVNDNWNMSVLDRGVVDLSAGGQAVASITTKLRKLGVSISKLNSLQALGYDVGSGGGGAGDVASIQGMQMYAGNTGEVIVIPRTSDSVLTQRLGVYGHIQNEYPIRKVAGDNYAVDLTVIEER